MNIEALEQLVRVLNEVQSDTRTAQSFCLDEWFDRVSSKVTGNGITLREQFEQADQDKVSIITIPHACGTTACACGYAGLDPWFRERGFTTNADGSLGGHNNMFGWAAVKEFFQITHADACFLFDIMSYIDGYGDSDHEDVLGEDNRRFDVKPHHVIDRVERTIARGKLDAAHRAQQQD